jgi:phosphodiesterase/alkaline phosphatase D-like protein
VQAPGLVTSHSVLLERLTPGTTYYYRVSGSDSAGNFVSSAVLSFQTSGAPVATPTPTPAPVQPTPTPTRTPTPSSNAPQITSGPSAAISGNGTIATITWTTNVPTSTTFRHGSSANEMLTLIEQPAATTSHSVTIERLLPNTTYYYQIRSCTTAGQCVSTTTLSFTTTV